MRIYANFSVKFANYGIRNNNRVDYLEQYIQMKVIRIFNVGFVRVLTFEFHSFRIVLLALFNCRIVRLNKMNDNLLK